LFRSILSLVVLSGALGTAVFLSGGVVASQWNWCLLAFGVASFFHFALARDQGAPLDRITAILLAIIGGIAVLQIVPLPAGLVAHLSPARMELVRAAAGVAGPAPGFVTLSAVPFESAQMLLTLCGCGLLFLVLRDIAGRDDFKWMAVWPLLIVAAFESGLGMLQIDSTATADPSSMGTYANRDHYAGLIEMVLPLAVMYAVAILQRNPKRHESPAGPAIKACGIFTIAALILVAIIHSLSRMGFLASLAALFVSAALALSVRGWSIDLQVKPPLWRRALPIAAVAVIVILGFIFLPTDPLIARFSELARTDDISADTRAQIWRETAGLIKAFPLFGCGLGGYESCFMRFKTVAPMNTIDYAHNDYLQILAELGIFAFLAGVILGGRLVVATIRRALHPPSVDERFLMIGCAGSLVAMLLHSFVDFNLYVPANGAVFAWICGIAASGIDSRRPRLGPHRTSGRGGNGGALSSR
jgi:O-antigen ligase